MKNNLSLDIISEYIIEKSVSFSNLCIKEQIRIRELLINCRYHVENSEHHDNDNHFTRL